MNQIQFMKSAAMNESANSNQAIIYFGIIQSTLAN